MHQANRLSQLPPYLFVQIDQKKRAALEQGCDIIDFGVGDPDQPTPDFIIDHLIESARDAATHRYPAGAGTIEFRQAAADYLQERFNVALDPQREILALLGTKEGIGHLPTAIVNPGEVVLVPDPGYPVYQSGAVFAGAKVHFMPLAPKHHWLPVLSDIPTEVRHHAKLMYLNYPGNPTAACASLAFFDEAVAFAREYGILIAQDAAYIEIHFGKPPPSMLQVDGAGDVCIEFHSLSKTFNMAGWRIGFAAGNAVALTALAKVKDNLDSGAVGAVQRAGTTALRGIQRHEIQSQRNLYRQRRDALVPALTDAGWLVDPPEATFYVWASCPDGWGSMATATRILEQAQVVVIPGIGFGPSGEGYIRFALTVDEVRTREAARRIAAMNW